jgi:RimJ/RimL family protein N-acetyltransferase
MPWALVEEPLENYIARIRRFRAGIEQAQDFTLGMFDSHSGRFLGGTGLHRIDWELRSFDIGYWIRPSASGHGHVTEAVRLLTDLAFDTFNARRVSITCAVENTRSASVARRAGFLHEGVLRNSILDAYGRAHDRHFFALTDKDRVASP